jgi:hypothetical protein
MKNFTLRSSACLSFPCFVFTGCSVIGDIFEMGIWVGIILVILVVVLVIWIIKKVIVTKNCHQEQSSNISIFLS